MAFIKYTDAEKEQRALAKLALSQAAATRREAIAIKKAKKEAAIELRRLLKAEIRRRREAAIAKRQLLAATRKEQRETDALKKKCRPLILFLKKRYVPICKARRQLKRLKTKAQKEYAQVLRRELKAAIRARRAKN